MPTPTTIGFLLFPDITQLDLTGPAQVLSRMPGATLHFAAATLDPVVSDCGLALVPTVTLSRCPPLDIVCVPGGYGTTALMGDKAVLDWLRTQAASARYVTSVCTGSLVLAAAGLLDGYRAGCHWAWGDQLSAFGATYVPDRTVIDRNRITAGGVTSGIDFAFRLVAETHGRDVAEAIQLGLEYDPQPLGGGTPATARPEVRAMVEASYAKRLPAARAAIADIAARRQSPPLAPHQPGR